MTIIVAQTEAINRTTCFKPTQVNNNISSPKTKIKIESVKEHSVTDMPKCISQNNTHPSHKTGTKSNNKKE